MGTKENTNHWYINESQFKPERQHHSETIFTIGNGYLATRGTFEERFPLDSQATLIHGLWDDVPIGFTELANAPDWTSLEIWCNDIRFDMATGIILEYKRTLDLRNGTLGRNLKWSPDNSQTVISMDFERFTSLADQQIMGIQLKVIPLSSNAKIRIRATLDSHVENNGFTHWNLVYQDSSDQQADLCVKTRRTDKTLALSTRLEINNISSNRTMVDSRGCPGLEAVVDQNQGETLVIHKFVGVATSRDTDSPIDAARKKVDGSVQQGYEQLSDENSAAWAEFWSRSDVIIEGDDEAQIAVRHALFQLRIAAPTNDEYVSIGAKTLSGLGYRGHVFWDTEIFILPFFTLTHPEISRNMLMYRYHTLPGARRKAKANGYNGAQFSWESAETGDEVTPTWVPDVNNPLQLIRIWTGDTEVHISADIVYALYQYWRMTGDLVFWKTIGIPILFETTIFWGDRAEREDDGYTIRDVIGPDEYHEHVDNNVFTNRMVQWQMDKALEVYKWLRASDPEMAEVITKDFDITQERLAHWQDVRDNMTVLYDPETGLFEQFEGFFKLNNINCSLYGDRTKSMQEILGIEGTNLHQVIKQPDVVMLLCLLRDEFDQKIWQANWDYYNPRTDHSYGSSLGPAMQAWAACEMGQPDLAYEHFMRASRADLIDVRGNADDGIHAASAGGLWQAIAFGFAGLNFIGNKPSIRPRLPSKWKRLSFPIIYHGITYHIDITPGSHKIQRK
ncbi:MAG: glycoside hydrolase family 65 protein [Anaerolineales bacterium]|nr:glycoside hydrolase family 65 protein [Anaerolineales bacterium]